MSFLNQYSKKNLNHSQLQAVEFIFKPLIVIAGAGSGKTRVITYKIANLIHLGFSPHKILAITFTKKAANEMKERVKKLTDFESKWVSTFHSFCLKILKENFVLLDNSLRENFTIYDQKEAFSLFRNVCKKNYYGDNDNDRDKLFKKISYLKQYGEVKPSDFINRDEYRIYELYEQSLIDCNAVDFDNIQLFANRLLSNPEISQKYKNKFDYILIDEFQDTSPIQYQIVKAITKNGNITVVGDPQQSIYSFRGAVADNVLRFMKDFSPYEIKLEENYRSGKLILYVANSIAGLIDEKWKSLILDLKCTRTDEGLIKLREFNNELEEAQWIADNIKVIKGQTKPKDIAILVRSRYVKTAIKEILRKNNIIFDDLDDYDFFQRAEVKDVLAYLKFAENHLDFVSFERAITTPNRGIGERTIQEILEIKTTDYLQAIKIYAIKKKNKKSAEVLKFIKMIEYIHGLLHNPAEALRFVIKSTDYINYLKEKHDEDAEDRYATLVELYEILKNYNSFKEFLDSFLLTEERKERNAVKLMTIHAAKGLEFDVVFLPALEVGIFPDKRNNEKSEKLDEEVRLFYVAVTRAKRKLYLSACWSRKRFGKLEGSAPGMFFRHTEKALLNLTQQKVCVT